MDGLDARKSVYVIAATNRPDMIDPAMCRPGRLDKLLYVDMPSAEERAEIIRTTITRRSMPLEDGVLKAVEDMVRSKCDGYSGADLVSLVREAAVTALRQNVCGLDTGMAEDKHSHIKISLSHFEAALDNLGPSVSFAQRRKYEALRSKFAGLPVKPNKLEDTPAENIH